MSKRDVCSDVKSARLTDNTGAEAQCHAQTCFESCINGVGFGMHWWKRLLKVKVPVHHGRTNREPSYVQPIVNLGANAFVDLGRSGELFYSEKLSPYLEIVDDICRNFLVECDHVNHFWGWVHLTEWLPIPTA